MNLTFVYVAFVYAIFVVALRRCDDRLRPAVAAMFYLLVVAFFFDSLVGHSIDLPADVLGDLPPWSSVIPRGEAVNPSTNDIVMQFVPWAHEVREAWKSLALPLWNDSVGGGYPLLANGQSSALSPIRILSIPLGLGDSFSAEAAFKLLIAMTFGYLWARRRSMSETASVITALCFGFSMGLHAWLHFPHATTAAMIPAIFYAVDRLVLDGKRSGVVWVAIVFAITLLSGHPETAAHAITFGGFWFVFVTFTERRGRWKQMFGRMTAGCVLALFLASPFLIPFLEALPRSLRMEALRQGLDLSVPNRSPDLLVLMLHGRFFGQVGEEPWGPVHPEFASAFAGMIAVAGFFAVCVYVARRRAWSSPLVFFVAASLFSLMAIFSIPPVSSLLEIVPPFSFAANGRLRIVLCWLLAVCAGAMIDLVRKRELSGPIAGGISVVVLLVMAVISYDVVGVAHRSAAIVTAIPGVLSIGSVFLFLAPGRWKQLAAVVTVAFATTDLWLPAHGFNPEVPENYLYPDTPLTLRLQDLTTSDPIGPVRMTALGGALFPNAASVYGLEDLRAHDPMANARTLGYMRVLADYSSENYFAVLQRIDHSFLDFMNVRYLATAWWQKIETRGFVKVYEGPDGRIWRNDEAMPRFKLATDIVVESDRRSLIRRLLRSESWEGMAVLEESHPEVGPAGGDEPLDIVRRGPGSYRVWVSSPGPRVIISSLPWWPGWRVRSKGVTLETVKVNGGFLGILVPAGPTRVKITYRPLSFQIGIALMLISLVAIFIYLRRPPRGTITEQASPRRLIGAVLLFSLLMIGCGESPASHDPEDLVYPGSEKLHRLNVLFERAHHIMNPRGPEDVKIVVLSTPDPIEEVATYYANLYGIESMAENQVNDFSAVPPRAYYVEGDLRSDFRKIEWLLKELDLEVEVDRIEGRYVGAHIDPVRGLPRITLQQPYVDPVGGKVVDETLILLVK